MGRGRFGNIQIHHAWFDHRDACFGIEVDDTIEAVERNDNAILDWQRTA
ncbi:MAG: hypothetical protein R2867_33070 [Caldilineaceae bacterium]